MIPRQQLAQDALKAALQLRRSKGIQLTHPLCVYDLAQNLGVDVWFKNLDTMEGTYVRKPCPHIVLGSHRPLGRRAFSCAHEIGHHVFKHGKCIDQISVAQLKERIFQPDEFLVNCFAGFLLMPKLAISRAFAIRGWKPESCTALEIYIVSGEFGAGYATLVSHMAGNLGLFNRSRESDLLKVTPKRIKSMLLGKDISKHLVIVDQYWTPKHAIDVEVEDYILLPKDAVIEKGQFVKFVERHPRGLLFQAVRRGFERVSSKSTGLSAFMRVSRRNFVGVAAYRHLEDPDEDE